MQQLHEGILLRSSRQQYSGASFSAATAAAMEDKQSPDQSAQSTRSNRSNQQQQATAVAAARPGPQSEVGALMHMMGAARGVRDAALAADALAAVRLALARQGVLAPFKSDVRAAFMEVSG